MPDFAELLSQDWVLPLAALIIGVPSALLAMRQLRHRGEPAGGDDKSIHVGKATTGNQSPQSIVSGDQQVSYGSGDIVKEKTVIIQAPAESAEPGPAKPTLLGAPRESSAHFVGRDAELATLERELLQNQKIRVTASLSGLAGIGKTELALHMVRKADRDGVFPGGIYWLNAEEPDLSGQWAEIAIRLGIPGGSPVEAAGELIRRLDASSERTLVVLDNAAQWPLEPLPHATNVSILITTRDQGVGGNAFKVIEVGFLDPDDARKLLGGVAGRTADGQAWDDLLEHLAGHALALELAGAYLREYPEESPDSYLAALVEGGALEEKVRDQSAYQATVEQAMARTWSRLSPNSQRAWCVAAQFAPEFVSLNLSEACGVDQEARRQLKRFHLVERDEAGRWRMHRLTRQFGLDRAGELDPPSPAVLFLQGCVEVAEGMDSTTGLSLYLPDRAHFDAAVSRGADALGHDAYVSLLDRVGKALRSAGSFDRSRELHEQALASDLETYGEDHPTVATRRSDLARVLQDQGDLPGARELLERALASHLETYGDDYPAVATDRDNLAGVLQDQGDLPGARELYERALASGLETYSHDHPTVATRRNNLASVLQDQGDLPGARELFEQALASDLETHGHDHPTVATCRSNLAGVLHAQGDLAGARELHEQALASDLETYGDDHPEVAKRRNNLASVLHAQADLAGAREFFERALASDLETYGDDHPTVATRRNNLARVLHSQGDLAGARELLERALASDLETYSHDHPDVATRHNNLASVLQDQGDLPGARELYEQALASDLETYGEDHPTVAADRSNLAGVLQDQGDLAGARELYEQALASDLKTYGEDHPEVAKWRNNLAGVLRAQGDLAGAHELYEQALRIAVASLGSDHPTTEAIRNNLRTVDGYLSRILRRLFG